MSTKGPGSLGVENPEGVLLGIGVQPLTAVIRESQVRRPTATHNRTWTREDIISTFNRTQGTVGVGPFSIAAPWEQ